MLLLQARAVTLRDERAAEGHRDTISDGVSRCLLRSTFPPLQIGNAAPTLPLYVLTVHWSVPHSLPFRLSLVLSLAHTHNHTQTEVYIRPFEWDMILICITDIHPYIHAYSIHACMHVFRIPPAVSRQCSSTVSRELDLAQQHERPRVQPSSFILVSLKRR